LDAEGLKNTQEAQEEAQIKPSRLYQARFLHPFASISGLRHTNDVYGCNSQGIGAPRAPRA